MTRALGPIRGEITEIVGGLSSGRTSHLLACLGEVAGRGETAALVDTEEIFDPASAAEAGIDLRRLLWVRCGGNREVALRAAGSPDRARRWRSRPSERESSGPAQGPRPRGSRACARRRACSARWAAR